MAAQKLFERLTIAGVELIHTYRGYHDDIEVYTAQVGDKTYSLYRKPNETAWRCDWTASYNCQPIDLEADPTDREAMLQAFAALVKSLQQAAH